MGKIPDDLRQTIARNIKECREKKYPGRGGGKKCAEGFSEFIGKNVSPQQWSPWERGMRTPDETRLKQIAEFFGKDVEFMRRDNTRPSDTPSQEQPGPHSTPPPRSDPFMDESLKMLDEMTGSGTHSWVRNAPGSPASFFWLARYFVDALMNHGLRIDKQCIDYLAERLRTPRF